MDFEHSDRRVTNAEYRKVHGEQKSLRAEVSQLNSEIRTLGQYFAERKIWKEYCESGKTEQYFYEHEEALEIYQKLRKELQERYENQKLPDIKTLKARKQALLEEKEIINAKEKELSAKKQQTEILLSQKIQKRKGKAKPSIE